jgi:hypothetical protein
VRTTVKICVEVGHDENAKEGNLVYTLMTKGGEECGESRAAMAESQARKIQMHFIRFGVV